MLAPAAPSSPRLRAISELTYGLPEPELVPGVPRAPQTAIGDTSEYPWRVNAALIIRLPDKEDRFLATGWFIGPYAVITAGHAVYPRERGGYSGWAGTIEVIAGLSGFPNAYPFGSVTSSTFYCPNGWQESGDPRLDYGVVLLNEGLGSRVGSFGYATYANNDLRSAVANLAGYPLHSPDGSEPSGRQWYAAGAVASVDDFFVSYDLGTLAGESGSCVYRNIGDESYAMAIHTSVVGDRGRGLRITEPVFANLQQWATMQG